MQPFYQTLSQLSEATGQAVSRTVGNVTAGVGNMAVSVIPTAGQDRDAPTLDVYSSDDAHRQFKEFNTDLNLKLNKLREWQGYLSTAVFWMFGSAMTLATAGAFTKTAAGATVFTAEALGAGLVSTPFLVVLAATVALGAIKMVMSQHITKLQTEKGMDVSDFHLKREAELTGAEVAKSLAKVTEQQASATLFSEPSMEMVKAKPHVSHISHEGMQQQALAAGAQIH